MPSVLDGVHREQRRVHVLALRMDVLLVVLEDVRRHQADALVVVVQRLQVEIMATAVVGVVHLLGVDAGRRDLLGEDRALVLDREP